MENNLNTLFFRRIAAWSLAVLLGAGSVSAAQVGVTASEIVLGMNISLNGGKNNYGVAALQGMNLYLTRRDTHLRSRH